MPQIQTIYCQIEDDLRKVSKMLEDTDTLEIALVFPKRSYFFGDSINLRLLKKHADILGKKVVIVTADERGQVYAKDAGFTLRPIQSQGFSGQKGGDIRATRPATVSTVSAGHSTSQPAPKRETANFKKTVQPIQQSHKVVRQRPVPEKLRSMPVPKVQVQDTFFPDVSGVTELLSKKRTAEKNRSGFSRLLVFGALVGVIVSVFVGYPSAQAQVVPTTEVVKRSFEINLLSKDKNSPDSSQLALESQLIDRTLEVSGKFEIDGKREVGSKARGKVKVLNLSGLPLSLRAVTTTLVLGDKKYSLVSDLNAIPALPASKATDQTAGFEAEIVAQEAGTAFNVPTGTRMEISNQVFGSKPNVLFARTSTEVTGGNSRFVSVITSTDSTKIREKLTSKAISDLQEEFEKKGLEVPKEAGRVEVVEFKLDQPEGTETPTVGANLKVRIVTVAFDGSKLLALLRARLERGAITGKKMQDISLDLVTYNMLSLPDDKGNGRFSAEYTSRLIQDIDLNAVRKSLVFGSPKSAEDKIRAVDGVEAVQVKIEPSWVPFVPILSKRISVTMVESL